MFRSQTPINTAPRQDAIVLACLASGVHVQVGAPQTSEGAHTLFAILDDNLNGYGRTKQGAYVRNAEPVPHTILGAPVKFYRVRQGTHEFGSIAQVPVNRVAGVKLATK